MLKFLTYDEGGIPAGDAIRNAYLIGSDNNAIGAHLSLESQGIVCEKRETGVAALALAQDVGACGHLVLQTCLLPEREKPYLLSLELARHRLLLIYNKLEDWLMFEASGDEAIMKRFGLAKRQFIEALSCQYDDPPRAEKLAKVCLTTSIDAGEALALRHAELLMTRRRASAPMSKYPIGCGVTLGQDMERVRAELLSCIDFYCLFTPWRDLVPQEGQCQWAHMDRWSRWLSRRRVPAIAGPVACFESRCVPDWLFMWEHDYATIRDLVYEHTERVISRYRNVVGAWNVISGIHVNSHFNFNFEQIMELTRMTTMLVKKIQPAARALVGICQPFGEYYALSHRSIPPLMYADLLIQSDIAFDGFVIKLIMGQAEPGQSARDLLQVTHLLDQFVVYGKPVTLVVCAPSGVAQPGKGQQAAEAPAGGGHGGYWRRPWSEAVQGRWLEAIFKIAMSKPFVEAVAWHQWADQPGIELPMGGLISGQMQPKPAFRKLAALRRTVQVHPQGGRAVGGPASRSTGEADSDCPVVS